MPRVLLVDDDRDLLALLARGFRYEGFDVCTALSGHDGLELASGGDCDVVVLDIGMPGLDGFGVLRRLRLRSDVPVVMLTARDEVDDKVAALGGGPTTTSPSRSRSTSWWRASARSCAAGARTPPNGSSTPTWSAISRRARSSATAARSH
jgi:CheY-like chemotaxis protein